MCMRALQMSMRALHMFMRALRMPAHTDQHRCVTALTKLSLWTRLSDQVRQVRPSDCVRWFRRGEGSACVSTWARTWALPAARRCVW